MTPIQSRLLQWSVAIGSLYALTTPNPLESLWSVVLISLVLRWFWWKEQPGIILICLITPFFEIHTTVIEANNYNLTLNTLYEHTGRKTFWISSIGFTSVAAIFHLLISRRPHLIPNTESLKAAVERTSQIKLLIAYAVLSMASIIVDRLIPWGSGLHQLETYFGAMPQVLLIAIGIHFWISRKRPILMAAFFLALVTLSFYSYFSEWRLPFTILGITLLTSLRSFEFKQLVGLTPLLIPAMLLVLLWQSVKGEYRAFLSDGQLTQAVLVDRNTALNKFQELSIEAVNKGLINDTVVASTYRRAGYLEYFSAAVKKVPNEIPYEQGKLLEESLSFSLVPRILNPNKGLKNDRAKVERYTDYYFGAHSFSSFSLGHYCEAYIDWGPFGMMIQMIAYALIGIALLRFLHNQYSEINPLLYYGLIWVILQPWGTFQQDMVTVSGTIFWGSLCHLLIFRPLYKLINGYCSPNISSSAIN